MANIFKADEAIGRKQFIITSIVIFIYSIFAAITAVFAQNFFDVNKVTAIIIIAFSIMSILIVTYICWLNYVKRIWDLIGDKYKAIFYVSAWWIANIAMGFIPVLRYVSIVISLAILAVCVFIPTPEQTTIEQTPENNSSEQ